MRELYMPAESLLSRSFYAVRMTRLRGWSCIQAVSVYPYRALPMYLHVGKYVRKCLNWFLRRRKRCLRPATCKSRLRLCIMHLNVDPGRLRRYKDSLICRSSFYFCTLQIFFSSIFLQIFYSLSCTSICFGAVIAVDVSESKFF